MGKKRKEGKGGGGGKERVQTGNDPGTFCMRSVWSAAEPDASAIAMSSFKPLGAPRPSFSFPPTKTGSRTFLMPRAFQKCMSCHGSVSRGGVY